MEKVKTLSPSNSELHGLHPSAEREEQIILKRTYYSVGGGFVMVHTTEDPLGVESLAAGQAALNMDVPAPHPFTTGAELLAACEASGLSVAELVHRNEEAVRPRKELNDYLDLIANTMFECVDAAGLLRAESCPADWMCRAELRASPQGSSKAHLPARA